ncbi:hypothetical protein CROQUDRAFT_658480 [Cronartium quercuum f. sp. fusiforme G11]|uniref:Ankyrin n=1 Tax=Cronartium quercuum f. sp. fusiforme G11 TaxID=708437 RepID=A0A9P6NJY5_9BASI|nr:hypothetical protein CROQUDRAFT_658480 [Cronartium quercuum f. sp. fusiforme G11]
MSSLADSQPNGQHPEGLLPSDTVDFAHRMFDGARSGNLTLLDSAIEAGLPIDLTNAAGNTLLMLASYGGHPELVKYLLSKGANPNRLNDRGQSPLSGAVFKGFREVVVELVDGGADPTLGQPNAIDCAYMFGKTDYWPLLGATEADLSPTVPRSVQSHRPE